MFYDIAFASVFCDILSASLEEIELTRSNKVGETEHFCCSVKRSNI